MVHSLVTSRRLFHPVILLRRGVYQVYQVSPQHRRRALPWFFDAAVAAIFAAGLATYLIA